MRPRRFGKSLFTSLATTGNKVESMVNLISPEKNYKKSVELITNGEVSGDLVKQFELNNQKFDENNLLKLTFSQKKMHGPLLYKLILALLSGKKCAKAISS